MFPKYSKNTPHSVAFLPSQVGMDSLRCRGALSIIPMEENQNEIWKDVVGYEGLYQVSNLGRIKSMPGYWRKKGERILSLNFDSSGYYAVTLRINGKSRYFKSHRLIAAAFIPNPENKPQINHINGVKTDNRIENLEWCTRVENIRHAIRTGLKTKFFSSDTHWARKPVLQTFLDGSVRTWKSMTEAGGSIGVSRKAIRLACKTGRVLNNSKFSILKTHNNE